MKNLILRLLTRNIFLFSSFICISCSNSQNNSNLVLIVKEPPQPKIEAKIKGKFITEDDLVGDDKIDYFEIKEKEYQFKISRLNRLIANEIIGPDAKKAGLTIEEYIQQNIIGPKNSISEIDIKKHIEKNNIPKDQQTPDLKKRVQALLQLEKNQDLVQNYLAQMSAKEPVEIYFRKPKISSHLNLTKRPSVGPAEAPISVLLFSDFQCPLCSKTSLITKDLIQKYKNKIHFQFIQFPRPTYPNSQWAAEASLCIYEQADEKFWKFFEIVFRHQDKLDHQSLANYAKLSGADMQQFNDCYSTQKYAKMIKEDIDFGRSYGVKTTPTLVINGHPIQGDINQSELSSLIDEEIAQLK